MYSPITSILIGYLIYCNGAVSDKVFILASVPV